MRKEKNQMKDCFIGVYVYTCLSFDSKGYSGHRKLTLSPIFALATSRLGKPAASPRSTKHNVEKETESAPSCLNADFFEGRGKIRESHGYNMHFIKVRLKDVDKKS